MANWRLYDWGYRLRRMPWELGPRPELVDLVEGGRLRPGRTVDLGCGTGANAIFLAQHGFDVTGIDFSPTAIGKARSAAKTAGVRVRFLVGDLTALPPGLGVFNVLVDFGTLDDLSPGQRDRYLENVLPLAAADAFFFLWCFDWPPRRRDALLGLSTLPRAEVLHRFGPAFDVERVAGTQRPQLNRLVAGYSAYLMRRRAEAPLTATPG